MQLKLHRPDWTRRLWLEIGSLGIGFGPDRFVERVWFRGKLVWSNDKAMYEHRLKAIAYERAKAARRALQG